MTRSTLSRVVVAAVAVIAVCSLIGCSGDGVGSTVTPPETAAPFSPTVYNGYSVYLLGGMYDTSYIAQDTKDHFTVAPGAYRPVCLREDEIGTAQVQTWA